MSYLSGFGCTSTSGYRSSIREIFDSFGRHRSSLENRKWEANRKIDNWSRELKAEIENHALEQKLLVEQAYKVHNEHLGKMREQFLELSSVYERTNNTEELNRLLDRLKTIKVALLDFKLSMISKEFIEVTTVEPTEQIDKEEYNSDETAVRRFEKLSTKGQTGSVHGTSFDSSTLSTSTASTLDQTK